jgi:hypothetical protein
MSSGLLKTLTSAVRQVRVVYRRQYQQQFEWHVPTSLCSSSTSLETDAITGTVWRWEEREDRIFAAY